MSWKPLFGVLLGLASAYLAYCAWDDARYADHRENDPVAASGLRTDDAVALARMLDTIEQRDHRAAPTEAEMRQIVTALTLRPLSRALLRQVGTKAEADGAPVRADAAMALSDALSRRDAMTQLWWIERSVQKDDLGGAVRHYHSAMAVHPELKILLLPILARALAFPEVRKAVEPYVVQQTAWLPDLLDPKVSQVDPINAAKLIEPVPDAVRSKDYEDIVARLLSGLADNGQFAEASKLARNVIPSFGPAMISSFAVSDRNTDRRLGTLAWVLGDTGRMLVTPNERGGFDVDLEPLDHGPVAIRVVPVIGGQSYALRQSVRGSGGGGAVFVWQATCVRTGEPVWRQSFAAPSQVRHDEFAIAVPSGCTGLRFYLHAQGPEGQQATHVTFEGLELAPHLK